MSGSAKSAALIVLATMFVAAPLSARRAETPAAAAGSAAVAGSAACRSCHEKFYGLWAGSWHGLAMRPYYDDFAAANLTAETTDVVVGQASYRAEIGPGEGWVRERIGDVETRYRIVEALGGQDVFYFLTEFDRGRLQTLPVAYDARQRESSTWRGAARRTRLRPPPGRWTGRTGVSLSTLRAAAATSARFPTIRPADNSYRTGLGRSLASTARPLPRTWTGARAGVSRRAGRKAARRPPHRPDQGRLRPCADQRAVRRLPRQGDADHRRALRRAIVSPTISSWPATTTPTSIRTDATSAKTTLTRPGRGAPASPRATRLPHCHTSSGRYKFVDAAHADDACLPCHAATVADVAGHSHHPVATPGSQCVACHMPTTAFARMRRSDH